MRLQFFEVILLLDYHEFDDLNFPDVDNFSLILNNSKLNNYKYNILFFFIILYNSLIINRLYLEIVFLLFNFKVKK